jgi:hypothetical protein
MRFEIRHEFDHPREKVEGAMLHADFPKFLLEKHGVLLEVEPKERTENDREIKRKVRYRPKPVIGSIGPKKVPPEWFAFIEESTYDRAAHRLTFSNVPTTGKIRNMLINRGTITLRELGPGRTERIVEGELKLDLPFLLKPLAMIGERVIHSEAIKLLDAEARVTREWLSTRG